MNTSSVISKETLYLVLFSSFFLMPQFQGARIASGGLRDCIHISVGCRFHAETPWNVVMGFLRPECHPHGAFGLASGHPLPLVESIDRHQAAPHAERGFFGNGLLSGVDHADPDCRGLGPRGDEAPPHEDGRTALEVVPDREHLPGRRDVVAAGSLEGQLGAVELEPPGRFAQVCHETASPAYVDVLLPEDIFRY